MKLSITDDALSMALAAQIQAWSKALGDAPPLQQALHGAVLALMQAQAEGHVCLPLPAAQANALRTSAVVDAAGPATARPLVLDDAGRLYLQRAFDHERALARRLLLAAAPIEAPIGAAAMALLDSLFAPGNAQHAAAVITLSRRLLVVSGGPGTGKTTAALRLLAVLRAQQPDCRIALTAPTGKAAARLAEAVAAQAAALPSSVPEALRAGLPRTASTVHRLIGARGDGRPPVHHAQHPLAIDVLVVDEASMLDLALARRLFDAVPPHARIVLLGDRDQLAAVEAGAVFAELSDGALPGNAVTFTHSHRFAPGSGIARLASALNAGHADGDADADGDGLLKLLREGTDDSVVWLQAGGAQALQAAMAGHAAYLAQVARAPHDVAAAQRAFAGFRVLCSLREGPLGVDAMNQQLARHARQQAVQIDGEAWTGRPLMVLRNDPLLGLFNGDIGITLPERQADGSDALRVFFARPDGSHRAVAPSRLPAHETAFASSVHKAQGSEFERVLVLPGTAPSRVLTRELLYTAITRARTQVLLAGSAALLAQAAATRTVRYSGLRARIQQAQAQARTAFTLEQSASAPPTA